MEQGQGSLACCNPWGHRVRHDWATAQLQWVELKHPVIAVSEGAYILWSASCLSRITVIAFTLTREILRPGSFLWSSVSLTLGHPDTGRTWTCLQLILGPEQSVFRYFHQSSQVGGEQFLYRELLYIKFLHSERYLWSSGELNLGGLSRHAVSESFLSWLPISLAVPSPPSLSSLGPYLPPAFVSSPRRQAASSCLWGIFFLGKRG